MAEEAIKKLEEQLNCSICLDIFTDPKLLQCFHVYCRQCLVPLVDRDQQGKLGLTCPICRQVTPIPDRGVAGLQPAFHINHLLELRESFQKVEDPAATLQGAAPTDVNPVKKARHCFDHEGKELELYCETCGELICCMCALKGGKHHDHDYEQLGQAFKKYKQEITSSLVPMEKQVTTIKKALAELDACCGEISDQRAATAGNIQVTFRRLREVLDVRETELIGELDQVTQEKLKGLAAQRDQLETTLAQLGSCLHFMSESLQPVNKDDVLMMKSNTVNRVKELTTPFHPDMLKPNTKTDTVFSASADMTSVCRDLQLFSCSVSAEVAAALLHYRDCAVKSFECELISDIIGTRAKCSIEKRGQSQYSISYQPTIKGRHQLHIKAKGQHIRGSPFSVAVKVPVKQLGTPIVTVGGLTHPWGVAINQRGEVVVTEETGHCVSVLSYNGKKIRSFGTRGSGQGQFVHPFGVAVDGEGSILVADGYNHRIQKFTAEGHFLAVVGTRPLQWQKPHGITLNSSNGKVYVADTGNHRVQVLNSDLVFSNTFGKEGKDRGQFDCPHGIACDSAGNVYVVDCGNHRIQVFTAEGKFLRMFSDGGQGKPLNDPVGVAIDASDMVYVSESRGHRISVFTSEGQFVTSFGKAGKKPGAFTYPCGLAVDDCGVVYVCDQDRHCIQLF